MEKIFSALLIIIISGCDSAKLDNNDGIKPAQNVHDLWYDGKAELSSYALKQARYGEVHEGSAVLIYVTEHFSTETWTKADQPTQEDVSVMKLNFTKKFKTGIYPYSMMNSTFFPFENGEHSLKISSSSQEWCGHTYMELKNKKQFNISISSYFEGENKEALSLNRTWLEDDFWTIIRLAPESLPIGEHEVIPSFFYLRLKHKETKAYKCKITTNTNGDTAVYSLEYPDLKRKLNIHYKKTFPYTILGWDESYLSGFGEGAEILQTEAQLKKTLRTDYWNKNSVKDSTWRKQLLLD